MNVASVWADKYDTDLLPKVAPSVSTMLDAFNSSVDRLPDTPLIHYFDTTLSVSDVDRLADALGSALQHHGLQAGERVALYLQNMPQFVISMVAVWKVGGIVASINPMCKQSELTVLLNDSGATTLICLENLYRDVVTAVLPDTAVRLTITTSALDFLTDMDCVVLRGVKRDRPAETLDFCALLEQFTGDEPDRPAIEPSDVAFLTYTSGTTGPPKGAMNTHFNAVFTSEVFRHWAKLSEDDVILGIAPLFHITGLIAHIGLSLLVPMPLVLGYRFDAELYLELAERYKATFTIGAITAFTALMNSPAANERDLSNLHKVWSGGQPVPTALVERYERKFGTYIHIAYGLTETTSPSHLVPLNARAPVDEKTGALAVGVPVFSTQAAVVDENGKALRPGEMGEIIISGPGVVPGYWKQPAESASAFRQGWLHTGDIGYMTDEGWFFVVDRIKDQINASGYKVWPREVEDVLVSHPDVREAAVIGIPDQYRGETVKAFVSLIRGALVMPEDLRTYCRLRLAAYKCPRTIEIVDEIPKNAAGKIVRRDLRTPADDLRRHSPAEE